MSIATCLALCASLAPLSARQLQPKPLATMAHASLDEVSGIVKSRRHRDTFWVHNDSGDEPRLFAIGRGGQVIQPPGVERYEGVAIEGAENVDWEDIASDGRHLYLSDLGNNGNARRNLAIYVVPEPDPRRARSAKAVARLHVVYPDQKEFPPQDWHFDSEALFWLRGKLYVITKHRTGPYLPSLGATLYRLDTRLTRGTNTLTKLDRAQDLGGWVTAADASPDGRTLAVLVQAPQQSVWLFRTDAPGDRFLTEGRGTQIKLRGLKQAEAICWVDSRTLLIANEQRELFEVPVPSAGPG